MTPKLITVGMVVATMISYWLMLFLNESVFTSSEFSRGMNWVYLPAGIRLLSTLLFGAAGAVGVFLASLVAAAYYYFPDDSIKAFAGASSSALAPYIIYRFAAYRFKFHDGSLANLTSSRLLVCCILFALANTFLHHLWLIPLYGAKNPIQGMIVIFVGDLTGTLIVLYTIKLFAALVRNNRST